MEAHEAARRLYEPSWRQYLQYARAQSRTSKGRVYATLNTFTCARINATILSSTKKKYNLYKSTSSHFNKSNKRYYKTCLNSIPLQTAYGWVLRLNAHPCPFYTANFGKETHNKRLSCHQAKFTFKSAGKIKIQKM